MTTRQPQRRRVALGAWMRVALASVALACTAQFEASRPPEAFVRQSRAVLGNVDFTLFHVPSHGLLRDRQAIEALKRGTSTEGLVEDLAEILRRGADKELTVSVGGGSSEKTSRVVIGALESLGGLQLKQLELLVILDPQHENSVYAAARASHCALRFADLDD